MRTHQTFPFAFAVLSLTFAASAVHALTWDPTDNGAAIDAAGGTYNLTDLNWNGTPNVAWTQTDIIIPAPAQTAVFAGTDGALDSYEIALASQMATTALTFNSTGYRITGSTLSLIVPEVPPATIGTNGAITLAAGKTATINSTRRSTRRRDAMRINP